MLCVLTYFSGLCSSGSTIYEIPKGTYACERLFDILFDPDIDPNRICHERPMHVTRSSTFVVDLDSLKHPDDVRKDEFGKWTYSGSHLVSYSAWKSSSGKLQFQKSTSPDAENTFSLRRIHCKHPSNTNFQRLLVFATGMLLMFRSLL